jgi:hypothetical protein
MTRARCANAGVSALGIEIAVDHRRQDLVGHRLDAFTTDERTRLDLWGEEIMKFRTCVEPPEPMKGLEVPPRVVESFGQGKRPPVTITINGHSWRSRVAIMRGRYLLGLSKANRQAAGVETGEEVEVELEFDPEPRLVVEPADFAHALGADPIARAAYNRLPDGRKREHVRSVESAKKPETRTRRIEQALAALRESEPAGRAAARGRTRASKSTSGES